MKRAAVIIVILLAAAATAFTTVLIINKSAVNETDALNISGTDGVYEYIITHKMSKSRIRFKTNTGFWCTILLLYSLFYVIIFQKISAKV